MAGDEVKFQELVLYISAKCQADPKFGAVKLNKILFLADFLAFADLGAPITGMEYFKLPHGPAPRLMMPIRDAMHERGDIVLERRDVFPFPENQQIRVIPQRAPRLDLFTAQEIALVDSVIEACSGLTGRDLSDRTHKMPAWLVAREKETIPYPAIFVEPNLQEEELEIARQVAAEHGWV